MHHHTHHHQAVARWPTQSHAEPTPQSVTLPPAPASSSSSRCSSCSSCPWPSSCPCPVSPSPSAGAMESLLSAGIVSHLSFLSSEVGDDAEALKRLLRAVEAAVFRAEAPAAGGGGEGGGDEEEQRCAYALATLLLESARTDCEEEHVRRVLMEEYAVDTVPATGIAAAYAVLKARMVAHLLRTGPSCPHVVGIDWRLDYSIASSITGRDLRPLYLVTLKVKDDERSAVRDLTMTCTLEQLQDLLAQVKDAVKQVDRILHASEADTGAAGGGGGGGGSSLERK